MCEIVGNAAIDGGKTVQRLLTFARGQAPDPPEMIGVVDLLHEVAQLTAPRWRTGAGLAGRPIGVTVDGDRDAMVHGAPSALREALINLVFNAIDAMPKGGVIALTARRVGTDVVVEVADSGDGMPAAVRTRIFEPFFTTKGELGTGLGLVQVRAIVQQHQGTIAVESRRGRGTTFRIALPWAPTTVPQPIESSAAAPRPASRRVLVVDDEAKLRTVTAKILRHRGLDTVEAASGEEALGHLALATFDVVVSDLGMAGGMSGWELAEEVKRRAPMTRFVLATGWGAEIDSEDARARGVDAVIGKPYRPDDLVRLLSAG
jgi:CheY-like chemotaxis protein